jgi:hypothetical protein
MTYSRSANYYGVYGVHDNSGNYGYLGSSGYGVYGYSGSGYAGYFQGNVYVSGNIGIGTTNPERKLHIAGSGPRILIEGDASNPEVNFKLTGDPASDIWAIYKHSVTEDLRFYQAGDKVVIQYNTGNVGIGTTNPTGKLDVNGSIYQRGGVLHADYVFEPDYKLETIEEHSDFMWQKKHLPAMPKMQKDENGREIVEIGARSKGVVEELEKAHIYIEQLNKENKELRANLATLKARLDAMDSQMTKLSLNHEGGI